MDSSGDAPDQKFLKSKRNQAVQKAGLYLLLNDPRFQQVDLPTKRAIIALLNGKGKFGTQTFDLIMKPSNCPHIDASNIEGQLSRLRLVEMKATRKAIQGPELNGFFFGATANEKRMAEQLGSRYLFAFVVLNSDNRFGRPFARLLTLNEVEARTKAWRTQYQVNFRSDMSEPTLVADNETILVLDQLPDN